MTLEQQVLKIVNEKLNVYPIRYELISKFINEPSAKGLIANDVIYDIENKIKKFYYDILFNLGISTDISSYIAQLLATENELVYHFEKSSFFKCIKNILNVDNFNVYYFLLIIFYAILINNPSKFNDAIKQLLFYDGVDGLDFDNPNYYVTSLDWSNSIRLQMINFPRIVPANNNKIFFERILNFLFDIQLDSNKENINYNFSNINQRQLCESFEINMLNNNISYCFIETNICNVLYNCCLIIKNIRWIFNGTALSGEKAKEIAINKFIHFIDNKLYLTKKDANNFLIINSIFWKLICIYSLNDMNRLLAKKVRSLALKSTEINIYKLSQLGLKPLFIEYDFLKDDTSIFLYQLIILNCELVFEGISRNKIDSLGQLFNNLGNYYKQ